jgi:site-specific recombinase XerD
MEGEINLKQAIEEYRDIYMAYRNFARRTREEYVNDLEDLVLFLGGMGIQKMREVNMSHLVRCLAELDKRDYAGSRIKRKIISIRSFLNLAANCRSCTPPGRVGR